MSACRIGFVMEQTLGHVTYSRQLEHWASNDPSILPSWYPIPYSRSDRWSRVPVVRSNMTLLLSLRARDEMRLRQEQSQLDVVFFHTQSTAFWNLGMAGKLPAVISLDASPKNMDSVGAGYSHQPDTTGLVGRLKSSYYRRLFGHAAALTTWSRWARDSLIRDYSADPRKIRVIPPGVDLDEWRYRSVPRDESRTPRLLFVGGDFTRKGGDVAL